ncbi:hypothetical protein EDD11_008822 [Mortierella claussenii]|nr:hypothetical protein EDD11_008822 [Mortierella claussenii]
MSNHSIRTLACLLLAILAIFSVNALPTPQQPSSKLEPFRFQVSSPQMDSLWLVNSLPVISWDTALMPEGSTMDIALLHHAKKQSILLRRYVSTRLGSTSVNLRPEITAGTYSLLLTVYKGRTSTVIGRSLVNSIIMIEDEGFDPEREAVRPIHNVEKDVQEETSSTNVLSSFPYKNGQNIIQETEVVQLTHQPQKGNLVLLAPYTVGWTIPKALENARHIRVNLILVSPQDEVVRALATNIDAKAGFIYVFLPEDIPLKMYKIKVEIVGKGRKFSGYTHKFLTSLPAFSARS